MLLGSTPFAFAESVCPFELELHPERLDLSRRHSVQRIHRTGPGEKRNSDLGGDPSLVLVEGIAAESIVLERILVDRVPLERVPVERVLERIAFERVPSSRPVQVEHQTSSVCHP